MMQEIGVAAVVLAAVAFLAHRFFGRPGKATKATTFIPLAKLKKKPPDDHCH